MRVVLVDDDPSVREGVSCLIRSHGFACTAFESGESVLAASELEESDCLVLDVQLSGIDGFATRDRLMARGSQVPIIFITANPEINSPQWRRQLKGSLCLRKPFEEEDLVNAIYRTLEFC